MTETKTKHMAKWQAIRKGSVVPCDGCRASMRSGDDYVLRKTDGNLYCITCYTRL